MKERRKIFSAADVAAIREGRKTMFREMVVPPLLGVATIIGILIGWIGWLLYLVLK